MMYMLFFAGRTDVLVPSGDVLRKQVKDPARVQQAELVARKMETLDQVLGEQVARSIEDIERINRDHRAANRDLAALLESLEQAQQQRDRDMLDARFELRSTLTRKEWQRVYR